MKVTDIFRSKMDDIQTRIPLKLPGQKNAHAVDKIESFGDVLNNELVNSNSNVDSNIKTLSNNSKNMPMIEQAVSAAAAKYNLNPSLINAVIKAESGFNPNALSKSGAMGLMQLMPATANSMGVHNAYDIKQNIDGGAKFLRQRLDQFGGDTKLALASYNAGPANVLKYGGIPPFSETKDYVSKVMNYMVGNAEK